MTTSTLPGETFSWRRPWSGRVPPHAFALLRIAFGISGVMMMAGMTPLEMHWAADGVVPLPGGGLGLRAWIVDHGLGTVAGWALYAFMLTAFLGMVVGYRSDLSVLAGYLGLLLESYWNRLPLSSAQSAMTAMMFCLVWAQTGRVWSIDALRDRARAVNPGLVSAWPLYLMRVQDSGDLLHLRAVEDRQSRLARRVGRALVPQR